MGKDFEIVDMVFPFVIVFIACATEFVQSAPIKRIHVMYEGLVNRLTKN